MRAMRAIHRGSRAGDRGRCRRARVCSDRAGFRSLRAAKRQSRPGSSGGGRGRFLGGGSTLSPPRPDFSPGGAGVAQPGARLEGLRFGCQVHGTALACATWSKLRNHHSHLPGFFCKTELQDLAAEMQHADCPTGEPHTLPPSSWLKACYLVPF